MTTKTEYYKGQYYDKATMTWIDVQKSFTSITKAKDYMFKQRSFGTFKDYDVGVRVVKITKADSWFKIN